MAVSKVCSVAVALMIMLVVIDSASAITCGQVTGKLAPCLSYLKNGGPPVSVCCNGVKDLNSLAKTPTDRKQACSCLKSLAASVQGINYSFASALPGKCGVRIPYAISPSTDCSKVN